MRLEGSQAWKQVEDGHLDQRIFAGPVFQHPPTHLDIYTKASSIIQSDDYHRYDFNCLTSSKLTNTFSNTLSKLVHRASKTDTSTLTVKKKRENFHILQNV